jgi:MFS family permease
VLPLAFGIIRDEFPKERVPGAIGFIAALSAAAGGLGLVLAGPIVHALDFHWLFWIPMGVLVGAAVMAKVAVPESPIKLPGRLNWVAALLLSGWLTALLIPISEAPTWGWGSPRLIGVLALAVVLAIGWAAVESRSSHPLIDLRMMRVRVVWTTNLVALLFGAGLYALFAFLPEFLQTPPTAGYGFGVSITRSGLILLPLSLVMFAVGTASGRVTLRFGGRAVLLAGAIISVVPFVMLVIAHGHEWEIAIAMGLLGAGFGLAFAAMSNLIVAGVSPGQTGVASGMNANIRTIGGSIGAAVMSSIVTASARHGHLPQESGYTHGFELLTVAIIASAVAAFFVPTALRKLTADEFSEALPHAESALLAGGTLVGDDPE